MSACVSICLVGKKTDIGIFENAQVNKNVNERNDNAKKLKIEGKCNEFFISFAMSFVICLDEVVDGPKGDVNEYWNH